MGSFRWPVIHLGVMAAGGVVSGASAMFTDCQFEYLLFTWLHCSHQTVTDKILDEFERQFLDSKCSTVFTDDANIDKVLKAVKNCSNVKV